MGAPPREECRWRGQSVARFSVREKHWGQSQDVQERGRKATLGGAGTHRRTSPRLGVSCALPGQCWRTQRNSVRVGEECSPRAVFLGSSWRLMGREASAL